VDASPSIFCGNLRTNCSLNLPTQKNNNHDGHILASLFFNVLYSQSHFVRIQNPCGRGKSGIVLPLFTTSFNHDRFDCRIKKQRRPLIAFSLLAHTVMDSAAAVLFSFGNKTTLLGLTLTIIIPQESFAYDYGLSSGLWSIVAQVTFTSWFFFRPLVPTRLSLIQPTAYLPCLCIKMRAN